MEIHYNNDRIDLIGNHIALYNLTIIQAQNVLIALDFDKTCLFETLYAFEEKGWDTALLGTCGSFIAGEYKGSLQ